MSIVTEHHATAHHMAVAGHFDAVIGVDAHTDTHTAAVLNPLGVVLAQTVVPADPAGAEQLLGWAARHAGGTGVARVLWAIDGTRSHGQGLARVLTAAGQQVTEATRPQGAKSRRTGKAGKSDALDAVAIARTTPATPMAKLAWPRADGTRETLRIMLTYRRHLCDTRTATINLFKALILTADHHTRARLRGLPSGKQARLAATWDPASEHDPARAHLAALAADILTLNQPINDNRRQLEDLVAQTCPRLLHQPGVGPLTAATALTAWSHPGRLRHQAAFAKLAGTSPLQASSGPITRHRLNRRGDRTLNSALHTIVITRRRIHPPTRDYTARRHAQGKTGPEITRCLKRYTARQLFPIMQTSAVMG